LLGKRVDVLDNEEPSLRATLRLKGELVSVSNTEKGPLWSCQGRVLLVVATSVT
jgi:hypothetical protein